jgi:rubredoxin-NAD+ reductase
MSAHPENPEGTTATDTPPMRATPQAPAPLVVVGAGLAGWTTVREFRKLDTVTPVIVVTADRGDFYAKPSLSNALAQKRTPAQLVTTPAAKMAESLNVSLRAFTTVTGIDTARHELTLQAQDASHTPAQSVTHSLAYGQLVLATGARPIRSPIAGDAADQVLSVNSLDDFAAFHGRLTGALTSEETGEGPCRSAHANSEQVSGKTVLVIGAGLIGCEFANDLLQAGHRVHVVDPSPRPLAALLPEAAGVQLQQALQVLGAHWHFGTTVQAVQAVKGADAEHAGATRSARDATAALTLRVTLADGTQVQADAVLSAIGLRADTGLASAAGLLCERGIVVDRTLQTSAEDVYALGDGAQYASAGARTLPYVMPIMNGAKALAATLIGNKTELVFPLMPVAIKTPALPVVVAAAHPAMQGGWVADATDQPGIWRFVDGQGAQHGFVLTGKSTARRMELSQAMHRPGSDEEHRPLP